MANQMRAADAMTRVLADRGVRYAFHVPGESFLGLLDALADTPEIELITTRHEGGAAFMADAVGKLTGQPAICMGTRGVGSSNLAIGIHTAYQDSTPMLALVGQVETPYRHREALQEVELAAYLGQITKWSVEPADAASLPRITADAYRRSVQGRPGPVAIALRGDLLDEPVASSLPPRTAPPQSSPSLVHTRQALDLLEAAKRPLIVAGAETLSSDGTGLLVEFAKTTGIPVATSFRRLDAFPTTHPLSAGSLSQFASPEVLKALRTADVVLSLGARLDELTTLGYTIPGEGATLIQVEIDPNEHGRSFPATLAIAASTRDVLALMLEDAGAYDWPDWNAWLSTIRSGQETADARSFSLSAPGIANPAVVVQALADGLGPDAVITCDAGNYYGWVQRFWPFTKPGTYLGPVSGAMGYAVPAAVAAAAVRRNQVPAVAVAGDGGFFMTGNELATAAMYDLAVKCVVFNNSRYGTIRLHQEREYPGRVSGTELWTPDLMKFAGAFGGKGFRIERDVDIHEVVNQFVQHNGIAILEVLQDRDHIAVNTRLPLRQA